MPSGRSGKLTGNPYNTNFNIPAHQDQPNRVEIPKNPVSQFMNIHKSCEDIIQRCEREDDNRR